MGRVEYYHEAGRPPATSVVACVFAVARDEHGRVLLTRRVDTGNWELPGGAVEPGESAHEALLREVSEETGIVIDTGRLLGIYTDPGHVLAYSTGEVRQQFAACFHARPVAGAARPDHTETDAAGWFAVAELDELAIHPSVRRRLTDALDNRRAPEPGLL